MNEWKRILGLRTGQTSALELVVLNDGHWLSFQLGVEFLLHLAVETVHVDETDYGFRPVPAIHGGVGEVKMNCEILLAGDCCFGRQLIL